MSFECGIHGEVRQSRIDEGERLAHGRRPRRTADVSGVFDEPAGRQDRGDERDQSGVGGDGDAAAAKWWASARSDRAAHTTMKISPAYSGSKNVIHFHGR